MKAYHIPVGYKNAYFEPSVSIRDIQNKHDYIRHFGKHTEYVEYVSGLPKASYKTFVRVNKNTGRKFYTIHLAL